MMLASLLLVALSLAITCCGLFFKKALVRKVAIALLAGVALFTVVFSMNDMRAHGSKEKALGRSAEYIAGMAERDHRTFYRRGVIFFSVTGLTLLALGKGRKAN